MRHIIPVSRDTASDIFCRYRALPGSDECATEFAIAALMRWVSVIRPKKVLELGVGIGTLSTAILLAGPPQVLAVVEREAWCREEWNRNVPVDGTWTTVDGTKTTLFRLADWPAKPFPADLLVVDDWLPVRYSLVEPCVGRRALVFLEGNRVIERAIIREGLRTAGRRVAILNRRPWNRSKGFWLMQADATIWERGRWALWTLAGRLLDLVVCPLLGVRPGWRRRDTDPRA